MSLFSIYSRIRMFSAVIRNCCSGSQAIASNRRQLLNKKYRIRLAAAYRGLDSYGLSEGVINHLTAIVPAQNSNETIVLIIPHGLHWSEVTPSNLIGVNAKNDVVEGDGVPDLAALNLHRDIYTKYPDVKAVMHSHMPYASALSCLENPELRMIHQNATQFFEQIAYVSYGGLGNTAEEVARLADSLGNKRILLMANHGVITVGETIDTAFDNMYYLERAAMIQILAYSTQQKLKELDQAIVELAFKQMSDAQSRYATSHLNSIIRRLSKLDPEFSFD